MSTEMVAGLDLKELFQNKILVCAGSGGVGKTTVSSTLAWRAAQDGKKVLVFTIDPSKRLASCLGLEKWSGHETLVQEFPSGGQMWASMIEAKKIFDELKKDNYLKDFENKSYREKSYFEIQIEAKEYNNDGTKQIANTFL